MIVSQFGDASFYVERGLKASRCNQEKRAIRYFERAVQVDPTHQEAHLQLARHLSYIGKYDESFRILYGMICEKDLFHEECYYLLGYNCLFTGKNFEAKKYIDKYLSIAVEKRYYEKAKTIQSKIFYEERTEEEKDENLALLLDQAAYYTSIDKEEIAIRLYKQIIKEWKGCQVAYNNLSLVYYQNGQVKRAIETVNEALKNNPSDLHSLCNKAMYMTTVGSEEEVTEHREKLTSICPILPADRIKLGATLAMMGDFHGGHRLFSTLQGEGYEGDFTYCYWFAFCSFMVGDKEAAERLWQLGMKDEQNQVIHKPWQELNEWYFHKKWKGHVSEEELEQFLVQIFRGNRQLSKKIEAYFYFVQLYQQDAIQFIGELSIQDPFVQQCASIMAQRRARASFSTQTEKVIFIAEKMLGHTRKEKMIMKHCLATWFHLIVGWGDGMKTIQHIEGLGAAVEYAVRQLCGVPRSQKEIALQYGSSVYGLRKWLPLIQETVLQAKS